MATRRRTGNETSNSATRRPRPATTPEAREQQLISLAYDLVERKIADGTASSQEITHFLKLGSSRERLEQERLNIENSLNKKKIEVMESHKKIEEMYGEALRAMSSYQGREVVEAPDDSDEY